MAATPTATQTRFAAGLSLEARGDYAGAAALLEALAHEAPADGLAADSLFEAAVLLEERLGQPARAATLYGELARAYPSSRLARRAEGRVLFLARSLTAGEPAYRDYQALAAVPPTRADQPAIAAMRGFVAAHPGFPLTDRAQVWLATAALAQGRLLDADAAYQAALAAASTSDGAAQIKQARARLALIRRSPGLATQLYEELAQSHDELAVALGREGLELVSAWYRRAALVVGSVVWLALFIVVGGFVVWRRRTPLLPLPGEVLFYAPVALLFATAAAVTRGPVSWATAWIAVGGAVVAWLTALLAGTRRRALVALAAGLAVVAVVFLSVELNGLTEMTLETLRNGPEA